MSRWSPGRSPRSLELPANWDRELRPAVRARAGGRCEAQLDTGERCPEQGTDADHIGDRHGHGLANLRWLCPWHHRWRTALQGAEATAKAKAKLRHPGITIGKRNTIE